MAATVASITPVKAPRQPACAAPITPASASANSSGPQSAVETPMARPRLARHHGIGARPRLRRPGRIGDDHVGRMDLIGREQAVGRNAERLRHARAVFRHAFRPVAGADAAIEAGIDAVRYAARAREEGVADAGELGKIGGLQHRRFVFLGGGANAFNIGARTAFSQSRARLQDSKAGGTPSDRCA